MALTLEPILHSAGIAPAETLVIRHVYARKRLESDFDGIDANSTDAEILTYTGRQSAQSRIFSAEPPRYWAIFIREDGGRARLWAVVENHGEMSNDGHVRTFDLTVSSRLADLQDRLVIGWRSPRTWWLNGQTAAGYPVEEIVDAQPIPFPGFDQLVLDHSELLAVMREHRYAGWRTALSSVAGIYLITDTRDGRQYVGKADGAETIRQRWSVYATNGHGGNVELRRLDPSTFLYSVLRVFDPSTPTSAVDASESHFKQALDSRRNGLNRN